MLFFIAQLACAALAAEVGLGHLLGHLFFSLSLSVQFVSQLAGDDPAEQRCL